MQCRPICFMKPYETSILVLVWGFAVAFWIWASGLDVLLQQYLFHEAYNQSFNTVMRWFGFLGVGRVQIVALLLAAAFLWWHGRKVVARQMVLALPVLAVGGIFQLLFKMMIGRPRPKEILWNGLDPYASQPFSLDSSFWSFPSGHATSTFLLATWLGLVFPRLRWPLWAVAAVLAASRFLAVTPHYMADVVAGTVLGTSVAVICWRYMHQRRFV